MLFGSGRSISPVSPGVLCLPVQMQEIIDSLSHEVPVHVLCFMVYSHFLFRVMVLNISLLTVVLYSNLVLVIFLGQCIWILTW